jgi:predicted SAM-dependent methyltransferase
VSRIRKKKAKVASLPRTRMAATRTCQMHTEPSRSGWLICAAYRNPADRFPDTFVDFKCKIMNLHEFSDDSAKVWFNMHLLMHIKL